MVLQRIIRGVVSPASSPRPWHSRAWRLPRSCWCCPRWRRCRAPRSRRGRGSRTLGLGVFCTGVAYVLYFRLIAHVGAAFAASVTFLVPVFGMIWGALFLGERVTPLMLAGCVVICSARR
ncbi:MAG: DMT family transporter [Pararobbsia sp.]